MIRRLPALLAILAVLGAYAFFAGGAGFTFSSLPHWDRSLYASQAEGFFRGQLHLERAPKPELMALPNPYDRKAREGIDYLWDASYLNGKYYLYFSPLPVFIFYMPYRVLRGAYPPDALAALFFAMWAFLAAVAFVRRALALAGRPRHVPFALWILLIGLANVAAYHLIEIRIYEVAILAGAAMTAMWANTVLRFAESPTIGRALWMSVWLSLCIATRPNLLVLLLVTAAVMAWTVRERRALLKRIAVAAVPLAIVASAMLWYNYARFYDPLELGQSYQLTFIPMQGVTPCSLCSLSELSRLANNVMHYVFWAPVFGPEFPFVDLQYSKLHPAVSFPAGAEEVVGIAPLIPLTLPATFFALILVLGRGPLDLGTRVALQVMAAAWLILLSLSTCAFVVSRYSLDFMFLITAATVVCIEAGFVVLGAAGVRLLPLRIAAAAMACWSIAVGFMLGFMGQGDGFKRLHPEKLQTILDWLR